MSYLKRLIACGIVICLLSLAACGGATTNTTSTPNATPTQSELSTNPTIGVTGIPTMSPTTTPVVAAPTATSGSGPQVILTPTPVSGGGATSQLVTLADRTLTIISVSQQQGTNSTAITLVMAVHNTGAKSIQNQASFYKLVGAEGDIFGLQSSATASFFGTILPQGSLNGTIVFQVPTAATSGLRLLFRSEVVTETVFVSLKLQ